MTQAKALLLALATFVVFGAVIIALFLALDASLLLGIGPVVVVGLASIGVYRSARGSSRS